MFVSQKGNEWRCGCVCVCVRGRGLTQALGCVLGANCLHISPCVSVLLKSKSFSSCCQHVNVNSGAAAAASFVFRPSVGAPAARLRPLVADVPAGYQVQGGRRLSGQREACGDTMTSLEARDTERQ